MINKLDTMLYVHIPFCLSKCFYCDFNSQKVNNDNIMGDYTNALIEEINQANKQNINVTSIFIGGGTPTVLPSIFLGKILQALQKFELDKNCEITIEANPETITPELAKDLKKYGVNRISIGVQTLNDKLLEKIGRVHTKEKFYDAYKNIINAGFENINVDVMSGLPTQTTSDYVETLTKIIELNPTHVSAYSLIVEEGTKFQDMYDKGELILPNEDDEREMYYKTKYILEKNGYNRYEISNYSKKDYECRHNVGYWKRTPYIGFGVSSHSLIDNTRYNNTNSIKEYLKKNYNKENIIRLTQKDILEEYCFLGLRLAQGINVNNLYNKYDKQINELISKKLIVKDGLNIKLTDKGVDLSNTVFSEFIL